MTDHLNILQITRTVHKGGSAIIAQSLHDYFRSQGLDAKMAVGDSSSNRDHIIEIPNESELSGWVKFWQKRQDRLKSTGQTWKGQWRMTQLVDWVKSPLAYFEKQQGIQRGSQLRTRFLVNGMIQGYDIIQTHTLQGGFFDLACLPQLSRKAVVVMTLHDAWLLSGHCAHSLDCTRWKTGCGHCPDLSIPIQIKKDATHRNWHDKQKTYAKSRLHIVTPSRWLMDKVEQSILVAGMVSSKVIPNGIDLEIFKPGDLLSARRELDLPLDIPLILYTATDVINSPWKNFHLFRSALVSLSERIKEPLWVICLGQKAQDEWISNIRLHYVPYQRDLSKIKAYYQAADLYLHPAKVDTFPTSILEALACGLPVIATNVGGIPEQVKSLYATSKSPTYPGEKATGILVENDDVVALAGAILDLIHNNSLRQQLSRNAAKDAALRFNAQRMGRDYLSFYENLIMAYGCTNA